MLHVTSQTLMVSAHRLISLCSNLFRVCASTNITIAIKIISPFLFKECGLYIHIPYEETFFK
jgi:hypothetical protein